MISGERLRQIGDNVIGMLQPDRQADQVGLQAGEILIGSADLLMGGDHRNGGDGFDTAEIGGAEDHLQAVEDLAGGCGSAAHIEAEQLAEASGLAAGGVHQFHITGGYLVANETGQARVLDSFHGRVAAEVMSHCHCGLAGGVGARAQGA